LSVYLNFGCLSHKTGREVAGCEFTETKEAGRVPGELDGHQGEGFDHVEFRKFQLGL
jgi:hypothetical protein